MAIENVALINELGQVVNHVVVDTDDKETMDALHETWETHRHVVTNNDVIILDESPEIWTTHCDDPDCDKSGFNLPENYTQPVIPQPEISLNPNDYDHEVVLINGRIYPADSWLIKENAHTRPKDWILPDGVEEVSLPK